MEKSLKVIRCENNFHYLEMTVTSISSSVSLEKQTKFLDYEKQVSALELLALALQKCKVEMDIFLSQKPYGW